MGSPVMGPRFWRPMLYQLSYAPGFEKRIVDAPSLGVPRAAVHRLRETALSRSVAVIVLEFKGGGARGNHGFTRDGPSVLETDALPTELRPWVREANCRRAFSWCPSSSCPSAPRDRALAERRGDCARVQRRGRTGEPWVHP